MMLHKNMDIRELKDRPARYSAQAQNLLEIITYLDLEDFEDWFYNRSEQTIIGSSTITAYLSYKKSICPRT